MCNVRHLSLVTNLNFVMMMMLKKSPKVLQFILRGTRISGKTTSHGNLCNTFLDTLLKTSHGGASGNARRSPMYVGLILWGTWIMLRFYSTQLLFVDQFWQIFWKLLWKVILRLWCFAGIYCIIYLSQDTADCGLSFQVFVAKANNVIWTQWCKNAIRVSEKRKWKV